jgi:hypothetical protein
MPVRRGAALVVALWLALLLGALAMAAARLAASGAGGAQVQADLARARAAAEGGAWAALHRLAALPAAARPPVAELALPVGGIAVRVVARDEDGRLDLNAAPTALLGALLRATGLPEEQAALAAEAAEERRRRARQPIGQPPRPAFATVSELAVLPGLDAARLALVAPLVTVHTRLARPAADAAPPALSAILQAAEGEAAWTRELHPALRTPATTAGRSGRRQVWRVEASAEMGVAVGWVTAIVTLGPAGGMPGRVLEWQAAPGGDGAADSVPPPAAPAPLASR